MATNNKNRRKKSGCMSPPDLIDVAKKVIQLEGRHVGLWDVVSSQFESFDNRITALENHMESVLTRVSSLERTPAPADKGTECPRVGDVIWAEAQAAALPVGSQVREDGAADDDLFTKTSADDWRSAIGKIRWHDRDMRGGTVTRVGPAVDAPTPAPPPDLACPVCCKPREAPGDPLCSAVHNVPPTPEDPAWEEARLERAVVDATLAAEEARVKGWAHDWSAGHAAIDALRAHRAKKEK